MVAAAAGLFLMVACDNISEKDRLIDFPLPEANKSVLIWEYTGQRCTNCPDGAKVISELMEAYPENVVTVCIHPEGVTFTEPFPRGARLTCETATEIYRTFPVIEFPYAFFDGQSSSESTNYPKWSTEAISKLDNRPPANLTAEAKADESGRITVDVDCEFISDVTFPMNLTVWIIENGLVAPQVTKTGGRDNNYVHNHVLRGSLNGTWGQLIGSVFGIGDTESFEISGQAEAEWALENCEAVVFLSDPNSHYVYQCVAVHIETETE